MNKYTEQEKLVIKKFINEQRMIIVETEKARMNTDLMIDIVDKLGKPVIMTEEFARFQKQLTKMLNVVFDAIILFLDNPPLK
jgi:hypothetical protein